MLDRTSMVDDRRLLDRRRVLIGGGFLLTAAVAAARVPDRELDLLGRRKLENIVPREIGPWRFYSKSGLVVPPQDQLQQQLYVQLLTRVYTAPDLPPIMLLIAQGGGQGGVLQIHRPEVCYPAGGYLLTDKRQVDVALPRGELDATAFTATADARVEQLMYWTRVGNDLPTSWAAQRWSVTRANLRGEIPDAVLVRVSAISPDQAGSMTLLQNFTRDLLGKLDQPARRFLVGSALA